MAKQKVNRNKLVDKIEQEILDRTLVLDKPGKEQQFQLEAARITRDIFVNRYGINSGYVPTVDEIRTYSMVYARALELLKQEG